MFLKYFYISIAFILNCNYFIILKFIRTYKYILVLDKATKLSILLINFFFYSD